MSPAARRRSIPEVVAREIARSQWRALRRRLGSRETPSGRRHAGRSLGESLRALEEVLRFYRRHAPPGARGGLWCEVGPGDSLATGVLVLGEGAREVVFVDRFAPRRDEAQQRAILAAAAQRAGIALPPGGGLPPGLVPPDGESAERFFARTPRRFDYIVSNAVLEHLAEPLVALEGMARCLRPGGRMVHAVDLRDHGLFAGHHPLTFLTLPGWLYPHLVRHTGKPNRVLLEDYRRWLARHPELEGGLLVRNLVGDPRNLGDVPYAAVDPRRRAAALARVREIRPRLARGLAAHSDEALSVAVLVLVATRRRMALSARAGPPSPAR